MSGIIGVSRKRYTSKLGQNRLKVPFCSEVRDFIKESAESQTLFANCEGFYKRRVGKLDEEKMLEDFVRNTMYYKAFQQGESQQENKIMRHVSSICKKMISLSQHYISDEIHFAVVWVYYFEYKTKTKNVTPVFKIFKSKSGNQAIFLDVFLKPYMNWEYYLETAEYPESFLCVPQHGEYNFNDSDVLLLEFVRSINLKTNHNECELNSTLFAPFSQVVIRPLLTKIKFLELEAARKITQFLNALRSFWNEYKGSIINGALFIIILFISPENISTSFGPTWSTISNHAFMLLNTFVSTKACNFSSGNWQFSANNEVTQNTIRHNLFENTLSNFQRLRSSFANKIYKRPLTESVEDCSNFSEAESEAAHFLKLMKSWKKNWLEIVRVFCSLFRKCSPFLFEFLNSHPNLIVIKCLHKFLIILEITSSLVSSVSPCELPSTENKALQNTEPLPSENIRINTELESIKESLSAFAFGNQLQSLPTLSAENHDAPELKRYRLFEKVLSHLPILSSASTNEIYHKLLNEPKGEDLLETSSTDIWLGNNEMLLGSLDDYKIYLFPDASLPYLTRFCRQLMNFGGRNFYFKPRGGFNFEVIDSFGKTYGALFFVRKSSAVGLFRLEAMEGDEKVHLPLVSPF